MFEITVDHPYHGEFTLTGTATDVLRQAMKYDHDCSDTVGCDIANMTDAGYLLIATDRMFSATECPTLSAVVDALPDTEYNRDAVEAEENEWWDEARKFAVYCPSCNSVMIGDGEYPEYCTNCANGFDPDQARKCA